MPLYPKDKQLIEDYLLGLLGPEEKQHFEQRKADVDFQKELEVMQDLELVFQKSGREALKSHFGKLEANRAVAKAGKASGGARRVLPRFLPIAAAALLLLGVMWWLGQRSSVDQQALFTEYFQPYPNLAAPILKGENPKDKRTEAFQLYEIGDYENALTIFESLEAEEEKLFYQAVSYLALDRPNQAAPILKELSGNASTDYRQAAEWYFLLAAIRMGQVDSVKSKIEEISKDKAHPFYSKAHQLRQQLF